MVLCPTQGRSNCETATKGEEEDSTRYDEALLASAVGWRQSKVLPSMQKKVKKVFFPTFASIFSLLFLCVPRIFSLFQFYSWSFPSFFFSSVKKLFDRRSKPHSDACSVVFACATGDPDLTKDNTTFKQSSQNNKHILADLDVNLAQPPSCINARFRRTCIRNVAQLCSFRWKEKKNSWTSEPFSSLFLSRKSLTKVMRGSSAKCWQNFGENRFTESSHLLRFLSGFFAFPVFIFFVCFFFFFFLIYPSPSQLFLFNKKKLFCIPSCCH